MPMRSTAALTAMLLGLCVIVVATCPTMAHTKRRLGVPPTDDESFRIGDLITSVTSVRRRSAGDYDAVAVAPTIQWHGQQHLLPSQAAKDAFARRMERVSREASRTAPPSVQLQTHVLTEQQQQQQRDAMQMMTRNAQAQDQHVGQRPVQQQRQQPVHEGGFEPQPAHTQMSTYDSHWGHRPPREFLWRSYRAAVVNYAVNDSLRNTTVPATHAEAYQCVMKPNLDNLEEFVRAAHAEGAWIVVLPEDALYGIRSAGRSREEMRVYLEEVPTARELANPCEEEETFGDRPVLVRLSCMALDYDILVVANMGELQRCVPASDESSCPDDGHYQFNTNVAFDATGKIIAKYRKTHLFYEPQFDSPPIPELVTFDSGFGVRFGMFTCFDMLFYDPAIQLAEAGVTDFVYPTAWVGNEPPFLVSGEIQQGWSRATRSNLLAANLDDPSIGMTGSGIFEEGYDLAYYINMSPKLPQSKLLVADVVTNAASKSDAAPPVPVFPPRERRPRKRLEGAGTIDRAFDPFVVRTFQALPGATAQDIHVCDHDFCCQFSWVVSDLSTPRNASDVTFAVGAFRGTSHIGFEVEVCGLFRCADTDPNSCVQKVFFSDVDFEHMSIRGRFSTNAYVFPVATASGGRVYRPDSFDWWTPLDDPDSPMLLHDETRDRMDDDSNGDYEFEEEDSLNDSQYVLRTRGSDEDATRSDLHAEVHHRTAEDTMLQELASTVPLHGLIGAGLYGRIWEGEADGTHEKEK